MIGPYLLGNRKTMKQTGKRDPSLPKAAPWHAGEDSGLGRASSPSEPSWVGTVSHSESGSLGTARPTLLYSVSGSLGTARPTCEFRTLETDRAKEGRKSGVTRPTGARLELAKAMIEGNGNPPHQRLRRGTPSLPAIKNRWRQLVGTAVPAVRY